MTDSATMFVDVSWTSVESPFLLWAAVTSTMLAVTMALSVTASKRNVNQRELSPLSPLTTVAALMIALAGFVITTVAMTVSESQSTALHAALDTIEHLDDLTIRQVSSRTYIVSGDTESDEARRCIAQFDDPRHLSYGDIVGTHHQVVEINCEASL